VADDALLLFGLMSIGTWMREILEDASQRRNERGTRGVWHPLTSQSHASALVFYTFARSEQFFFVYNNYNNYIIDIRVSDAFALAHSDYDSLPLDQHYYCRSTIKYVTDSDAFTKTSLSVARLQRRHCQWRVYLKMLMSVACLLRATASGALSFVDFKFYFYHSYY
jgi:hypothetical protein